METFTILRWMHRFACKASVRLLNVNVHGHHWKSHFVVRRVIRTMSPHDGVEEKSNAILARASPTNFEFPLSRRSGGGAACLLLLVRPGFRLDFRDDPGFRWRNGCGREG